MKLKDRTKLFFILVLVSALSTSCSRRDNRIAIRFLQWGPASVTTYLKKQAAMFEKMNPGIKVNWEIIYTSYEDKILTSIAGNEPPDVFYITPGNYYHMVKKKVLFPLDDFIAQSRELSLKDYYPRILTTWKVNGRYYGLPDTMSPMVIYYNKDMFDRAGIAYPKSNWKWDEFVKIAQKLTIIDRTGKVQQFGFGGFVFGLNFNFAMVLLIHQNGGKIYDIENKRFTIDTPEAIEAVQFGLDFVNKYKIMPTPEQTSNMGDVYALFTGKKTAMIYNGRWMDVELRKDKSLKYGIAPVPRWKKKLTILEQKGLVIPYNAKHPEEAWKFIEFMCGQYGSRITSENGDCMSALKKVADSDSLYGNPEYPQEKQNVIFFERDGLYHKPADYS